MIVVSDTTPITTLLKAGQAEILEKLFGSVIIPRAVADELLVFHGQLPIFVAVQVVSEPDRYLPGVERLGKGETQAIQLAKEGFRLKFVSSRNARYQEMMPKVNLLYACQPLSVDPEPHPLSTVKR